MHTQWVWSVLRSHFCVFPWQRSCKPYSASHHFPAFVLRSWPSTASPGSWNYSANDTSLNTDICVTKGTWTCHNICRQRTLRLREPQGSIFAPLMNICKLSVTVFERESNGMLCRTLWVVKMTCCLSTIFWWRSLRSWLDWIIVF